MPRPKVLIVDDDRDNVRILQVTLKHHGYEVFKAYDGEEALDVLFHNQDIELILLDIMMPVMDGITTLKRIRQHEEYDDIKVIMQTAKTTAEAIHETKNQGIYHFVGKPFSRRYLLETINGAFH